MEFYEVIKSRRSVRAYTDKAIPGDVLDRIGEAVRLAPSACNIQPWSFRIVLNNELRQKIASCYSREWLRQAPAIVLALGNSEECWKRLDGKPIIDMDIGIVMEHLVLAAAAEGLGTCWVCAYDVERMNKVMNIVSPWSILAVSPLGYPAETPAPIKRKEISGLFQVLP